MQNSRENIEFKLLKRYLEGNASPEDSTIVRQWLMNSDPEHELNEKSLQYWDEIPLEPIVEGYNGPHILDHIHHKIKIEEGVFITKTKQKISFISYLARIAAILFIPLLAASLLYFIKHISDGNFPSYAEIYAPYGTRTTFYLPDGSTGKLNGGSSLKYPVRFEGKVREVKLSGEAFFNVISKPEKPFVVSTENIDVKVYGTTFNVTAYADEQTTKVTLERGKVEVFRKTNKIIRSIGILKPNESLLYNSLTDSGKILAENTADNFSWLDGKLTFRYEPFGEVVRKINRWYNVNILIKDESLENYIYYGTFKDETIEEVLNLIHLTAPISYRNIERERKPDGTFEKRKIEIYYKIR